LKIAPDATERREKKMTKRMLVDATHPEETRVAIVDSYRDHHRLDDLDFDLASKPILRGNIYLAKVMRIEPSLQAAFVEYGGNRHGFLPFSEIHPDYYRIPMADRSDEEESVEEAADEAVEEPDSDDIMGDFDDDDDRTEDQPEALTESPDNDDTLTFPPHESDAPVAASAPADKETAIAVEPALASPTTPPALAETILPFAGFGDADPTVGLITDFGNAATATEAPLAAGEATQPESGPVESVGGEMTERIVRHGRPRYKIQEVLKRGQIMLIQVVKEERGNKGAALTTFLSLAGRYCVLMPNTDHGGGVSRKITNHQDRRRMKEILDQLEIPEGMAVILRTAGMEQSPPEIQRDLEYLLRLWDNIREQTLQSSAPALIYEEANLIKRAVRDLYTQDIQEILVAGEEGYKRAHDFMHTIMPDQVEKIRLYQDPVPLFFRYQVETQIDALHTPIVQLRSGGYLVINPTEALVSIDVNSGRATRERHIEETALKTNLEAAEEIARQLRLRDLAGLVVIDFIDMEDGRNNAAVERRVKEAMKNDRARLQIGRITPFGLMELSRQRTRPSLTEISFEKCPHCGGVGVVRSPDSAALSVLRAIEEEAIRNRTVEVAVHLPARIALYILNLKRAALSEIETRCDMHIAFREDETLTQPCYRIERLRTRVAGGKPTGPAVNTDEVLAEAEREMPLFAPTDDEEPSETVPATDDEGNNNGRSRRRPRRGRGFNRRDRGLPQSRQAEESSAAPNEGQPAEQAADSDDLLDNIGNVAPSADTVGGEGEPDQQRRRRRGRRGGRRRNGERNDRGDRNDRPERGERRPRWEGHENAAPGNAAPVMPVSVLDLDTTPKPYTPPAPPSGETPKPAGSAAQAARDPSAYEVINPPGDKPKGGWWRRLTGQGE
jgi:ribonuclease E